MNMRIASLALVLVAAGCGGGTAPGGNDLAGNGSGDMAGGGSCKDDTTCKAPTSHCDTKTGKCVGCTDDTQCPEGQVCTGGACVPGCNAMKACGDAGVCDVQSGTCKSCMADNECTDKNNPRCDVPNMKCVPCLPANDNCPQGKKCTQTNGAYMCADGCKADAECVANGGPNSLCCNGTCIDKNTDAANCGACGKSCNGQACCAGGCIDTTKDPANCGACGMACMAANGVAGCGNSKCTIASCNMGFADCDQLVPNGCEVDTNSDVDNCLGCGNTCTVANGVAGCMNGCVISNCNMGFGNCDNMYQNGCEADVNADPANCGGCGMGCSNANIANPICAAGSCTGACNANFSDCDNDKRSNGCEVNTQTNAANCGGCGMACSNGNIANPTCLAGNCNGTCNANFADCDNNKRTNGCEVNTQTTAAHCGGCGMACSNGNIANPTCLAGNCNGTCNANFADCDNNKRTNGCEVSTAANIANCGGCGIVCSGNNIAASCAAGICNGVCNANFADCDNNKQTNGCEANTQTSAAHCGGCGMACSNNHIAAPTCAAGVCNGTCDANFNDCDLNKRTNGCEVAGACGAGPFVKDRVLIVHKESNAAWNTDIQTKLMATGSFAAVDIFDGGAATPTLVQLQAYQAILLYTDGIYLDAATLGNNVADYYDGGGRVVVMTFANSATYNIAGRFGTPANGYILLSQGAFTTFNEAAPVQIVDANSPLVIGVATLTSTAGYKSSGAAINGGVVVARWGSSGAPLIIAGNVKGRPRADLNFFPPSSAQRADLWAGDGAAAMRNALLYGKPTIEGHAGPDYSASGWKQCVGYLDKVNVDDIPNTGWGNSCIGAGFNQLRVACGANAGAVRYIDVNRNVLATGLNAYPEKNLIINSNFVIMSNDIYATNNQPNNNVSWWAGGSGCGETNPMITINNVCTWDASDCFGQNLAGDRYLYVYVHN